MGKIIFGPGRLSFPQLFERGSEEYGAKYGTTILLPPELDLTPIKHALLEVAIEKWGTDKKKWPKMRTTPATVIKRCEDKDLFSGAFPDWHFINLSSKDQPGVIDANLRDVTDPREAYPGRWAMISANAYVWDNSFGKGVSLGLNNVQLRKHDDPLGGRARPQDEFDDYSEAMDDDDEEDEDNKKKSSKADTSSSDDWGD